MLVNNTGNLPNEFDKKFPVHRQYFITKALKEFKKSYGIKPTPIDCVKLLDTMQLAGPYKIRAKATGDLLPGRLARTYFIRKLNLHLVSINQTQLLNGDCSKYPFVYSLDRMLNFTIAHEIGHIALNHFELEDQYKDEYTVELEDLEADEFAERLLMPEDLLLSCNYMSKAELAEHFMVTEQALLKRLNQILQNNEHPIRFSFCHACGESKLSDDDEYCRVCGVPLHPSKNPSIPMKCTDRYPLDNKVRVLNCPRYANTNDSGNCGHGNIYGFYLYNSYLDSEFRVEIVTDSIYKYCSKCIPSVTYEINIPFKGWTPWDEQLNSKDSEINFYAPGEPIKEIDQDHWEQFLSKLSREKQDILVEALQGSYTKICGKTLLIFLRETHMKKYNNNSEYWELLLTHLRDYLELILNDEKVAAVIRKWYLKPGE